MTRGPNYEFRARFLRAIDGDTIAADLDLGLFTHRHEKLRLARIDTPEMNSPDEEVRAAAKASRLAVVNFFARYGMDFIAETHKPDPRDKYGRFLCEAWAEDDELGWVNLSDLLLKEGLAKPYDGGKK